MGVGKSTIGRLIAKKLEYNFVDIDILFEEKYKISIEKFFNKYGEKLFREFENKLLFSTFDLENTVIATGGGTPCHFNAIDDINRNGLSVYLKMPVAYIVNRLENAIKPRPLVRDKSHIELYEEVERLLKERIPIYKRATIVFNAANFDVIELSDKIRDYRNKEKRLY